MVFWKFTASCNSIWFWKSFGKVKYPLYLNRGHVYGMTMKSWKEKLEKKDLPKIVDIPERMKKRFGEGKMVVPSPMEVKDIMDKVPEGKLITVSEIRKILAKKHNVRTACPLATGIFVWLVAIAAEETGGERSSTPYWRTLKAKGVLNNKYPGGVERHKQLLEKEGFKVIKMGNNYKVDDFEKYLVDCEIDIYANTYKRMARQ